MAAYLSAAWLEAAGRPRRRGLRRHRRHAAPSAGSSPARPTARPRFTAAVADGARGLRAPGSADDVDVTLTDTTPTRWPSCAASSIANAAFMRGQTKVAGSTGRLLDVLAATESRRGYEAVRAELARRRARRRGAGSGVGAAAGGRAGPGSRCARRRRAQQLGQVRCRSRPGGGRRRGAVQCSSKARCSGVSRAGWTCSSVTPGWQVGDGAPRWPGGCRRRRR